MHQPPPAFPPGAPSYPQLRAFHAVATAQSFTRAARALGVSQPAVSMQVRALEESYGVELVARARQGAVPTELGRALLDATRPLFALEAEAAELLRKAGALLTGHLQVGADAPFLVVPILAAFRAAHPAVKLSLSLGNSATVLRELLDGHTEVAVLSDRAGDPRLFAVAASRSRQVLLVPRDHPWASRRGVRLRELAGKPMVMREPGSATRRAFERALAAAAIAPDIVMELGSREAVQEAVAAGLGAGVVIEAEHGPDARLATVPLLDADLEHTEHAVCLAERRRLRMVRAFFEHVPRLPRAPKKGGPPGPKAHAGVDSLRSPR
ncbi:MAG: LysR substrate-binding domain-containing protein [Byssovorax sp.]